MSYLRVKLQADRIMALNFEKALAEIKQETIDTGRAVLSSAHRASGYSTCFLDDYKDVCRPK